MQSRKLVSQSIIALVVTGFILASAPAVLSQYGVFSGYGYGYGACADAPTNTSSRYLHGNNQGKLAMRWDALDAECTTDLEYYQIQLNKSNNQLVEWWNTTNTKKRISLDALNANRTYKWRVRGVYSDGTATDWSVYNQFRTKPNPPQNIRVSNLRQTSVRVSGRNVARSAVLKRYQVLLKRDGAIIRVKSIKQRLNRPRFAFTLAHLDPGTTYVLKMRSIYSSTLKSQWSSVEFTTTE